MECIHALHITQGYKDTIKYQYCKCIALFVLINLIKIKLQKWLTNIALALIILATTVL